MSHEPALSTGAIGVEAVSMTKRFGDFTALDEVTLNVRPGTFHALWAKTARASLRW